MRSRCVFIVRPVPVRELDDLTRPALRSDIGKAVDVTAKLVDGAPKQPYIVIQKIRCSCYAHIAQEMGRVLVVRPVVAANTVQESMNQRVILAREEVEFRCRSRFDTSSVLCRDTRGHPR